MSKELKDLLPEVQILAEKFIEKCKLNGIEVKIVSTYRSFEEQDALYAQGRENLTEVNKFRQLVGLYQISEKENKIVTNAKGGQSNHNFRVAFDCVPIIDNKFCWDSSHPSWKKMGEIGKSLGLEWAGEWVKFKEYPHFQYLKALKEKIETLNKNEEHPLSLNYKYF